MGARSYVRSICSRSTARIALAKVCPEEFAIVIFVVLMMGIAIHQRRHGRGF
jgi:hypothetical protein